MFEWKGRLEILKPKPTSDGRLCFESTTRRIGRLDDGRVVLLGNRWRDWLDAWLGHVTPVESLQLAGVHYADVGTVALGWATAERPEHYQDTAGAKPTPFRTTCSHCGARRSSERARACDYCRCLYG